MENMKKGDIVFLTYSDGSAIVNDPHIITKVYESGNNLALIKPVNGGKSSTIQAGEFVTLNELLSKLSTLQAADLCSENEKKSHGYQLHQKIFTVAYDLWRVLQRKTNTNREVFSEIDIKRIENNKAILDKNMPPFDPKDILRRS